MQDPVLAVEVPSRHALEVSTEVGCRRLFGFAERGTVTPGRRIWVSAPRAACPRTAGWSSEDHDAVRWTPTSGLQDLGTVGGTEGFADDVSANAVVIVGLWRPVASGRPSGGPVDEGCVSSAPRRASGGCPRPSPTTTGATTGVAAVPPKQQLPIGRPPDGESSGWSFSYPPVVRRAHVGLLPSRSGRITMYAAAINRPSQATRSPEGARRCRADGVLARELGRCLPARPRRLSSTSCPSRASSFPMPFSNRRPARPKPGQSGSQGTAVLARGDRRVERTGESCEVQGSCGVPTSGVPGLCTAPGWVRRSAGRPGVRPSKAQGGIRIRLETVADGLTAPLSWVPEAEPASRACDA